MGRKVCHITSAHGRYDVRIFHKECKSLVKKGYDVTLIVNDDNGNEIVDGVNIVATNFKSKNRYERMVVSKKKIIEKALETEYDIYHLHDPDLLTIATKLKKRNKKVIFDSHEDYILTIKDKGWIPRFIRPVVKLFYKLYESYVLKKIDGAIVCYHWTRDRYNKYLSNVEMVLNFPIVEENIKLPKLAFDKRAISFAGGISSQWCHKQIIMSLEKTDNVRYELAGKLVGEYQNELMELDGWRHVNYHGEIEYNKVFEDVYSNSSVGMVLLDYISQCKGNIGNLSNTKFFEYMYMGLPIICTDFILWKEIIDEENCGIYVNPHDIDKISEAVNYLINNSEVAMKMGNNGQLAVIRKYNWQTQESKLLKLYSKIG